MPAELKYIKTDDEVTLRDLDNGLFRAHFENLPMPAFIWKRHGDDFKLISHNHAAEEMQGSKIKELIGITATELHPNRPDIIADFHRCADQTVVIKRETELRLVSGIVRQLSATFICVSPILVVVQIEDVTERRAAEQTLKYSEARARALFDSNPDVIMRMTIEGEFLDIHVAESTSFPFSPNELIGRSVGDFYGEGAQWEHQRYAREAVRTGKVQHVEYRMSVGDRELHLESRFVRSGDDEVVVNVRDITERVELEQELTIVEERERNRIGRDIHAGLAQKLMDVKRIVDYLDSRLSEENSDYTDDAARGAQLLNQTIHQVRELERGLSPVEDDMTLFDGLEKLALHTEEIGNITCDVDFKGADADLGQVAKTHLYRIAQESISNAVKHGHASQINIICVIGERELTLTVLDNGVGFRHSLPATEAVGLRIMRYRAKSIGGKVTLAPRDGGGAEVKCCCPVGTLSD